MLASLLLRLVRLVSRKQNNLRAGLGVVSDRQVGGGCLAAGIERDRDAATLARRERTRRSGASVGLHKVAWVRTRESDTADDQWCCSRVAESCGYRFAALAGT